MIVPARAQLPTRHAGLALGYRVLDLSGAEVIPFTRDEVIETAPGHYWVAGGIDAPDAGGLIIWGTAEQPTIAQAEIEPAPPIIDPTPAIAALGDRIAALLATLPAPVAIAEIGTDGLHEAIAGVGRQIDAIAQKDAVAPILASLEEMRQTMAEDERIDEISRQIAGIREAVDSIEPPVITTYPPADLSPIAERLSGLGADLARVEALVTPPAPDVEREIVALEQLLEAAAANHKERVLQPVIAKLERQLSQAFRAQGQRFLRGFSALRGRFAEAGALREAFTADDWLRIFDETTGATRDLFFTPIDAAARVALVAGAQNAIADVGVDIAFNLRNPRAEAYLQAHGYGLISQIDSVTRGNIATIIDDAMRTGQSYDATAKDIAALYSQMAVGKPQQHIDSRAHLIAVTEPGNAYEAGNAFVVQDLQDAGLKMEKKWLTVGDDRVSAGCRANEAEGWIPLAQAHRSGDQRPLRFPGCRCTELYQRARTGASLPAPVAPEIPIAPVLPVAPSAPEQRQQLQYQSEQRHLDRVLERIDEAIARAAARNKVALAEFERGVEEGFRKLTGGGKLAIQFSSENMDEFLGDPRFKTQFETRTSGGVLNLEHRENAEFYGLGAPLSLDPKDRPIYGYLNLGEISRKQLSQYGDVTFVLKDEVRSRTTVTMDDSLYNFAKSQVAGTPIDNPTKASWDGQFTSLYQYNKTGDLGHIYEEIPYIEIQIQGRVTLSDVAGVIDDKGRLTPDQRRRLEQQGVTVWDKAPSINP